LSHTLGRRYVLRIDLHQGSEDRARIN
jgi:hypothetical protein